MGFSDPTLSGVEDMRTLETGLATSVTKREVCRRGGNLTFNVVTYLVPRVEGVYVPHSL